MRNKKIIKIILIVIIVIIIVVTFFEKYQKNTEELNDQKVEKNTGINDGNKFSKLIGDKNKIVMNDSGEIYIYNSKNKKILLYEIKKINKFIDREVIDAFWFQGQNDNYVVIIEEINKKEKDFGIFDSSYKELFMDTTDTETLRKIINFVNNYPYFSKEELIIFLNKLKDEGKL